MAVGLYDLNDLLPDLTRIAVPGWCKIVATVAGLCSQLDATIHCD
jgi:hypothetical protein